MDVEGEDIGVLVFLLCFGAEPVIVFFPLFEHHFVSGVGIEVEGGFFIVAIEGGADEFAAGVLGVLGFFVGMGVIAGCQQEDGESGEEDFFDHGAKISLLWKRGFLASKEDMLKKKIYYVPGLFSLLGLPLIFFLLHPEDPIQLTVLRLRLPTEMKDSPGMVRFSRDGINRLLRGKKIISVELDDLPSRSNPESNAYRKSGFVLSEMARLQFTHDTTQLLKVSFGEGSTYGQYVWAVNNASLFDYRHYFYLDNDLYFQANPPSIPHTEEILHIDSFGPPVAFKEPPPPTRWEAFCEWVSLKSREAAYYLRHSYLLVAGFLFLIILPGLVRFIGRGGQLLLLFCLFRRP
jgi:hypothetical protein